MITDFIKKHRDIQRANNANSAVRGCIYADMNNTCIDTLITHTTNGSESTLSKSNLLEILRLAKDSNNKSKDLLVASQTSISRRICKTYAKSQVNQLQLAYKNKEDIEEVKGISKFILQTDMIEMSNKINVIGDQSGK